MPLFMWMPIIVWRAMAEVFNNEAQRARMALQPVEQRNKKDR